MSPEAQAALQYTHPEVVNHPQQAYVVTDAGRAWLAHSKTSRPVVGETVRFS